MLQAERGNFWKSGGTRLANQALTLLYCSKASPTAVEASMYMAAAPPFQLAMRTLGRFPPLGAGKLLAGGRLRRWGPNVFGGEFHTRMGFRRAGGGLASGTRLGGGQLGQEEGSSFFLAGFLAVRVNRTIYFFSMDRARRSGRANPARRGD